MEKYRAVPQGYMTVGELAKKMNTTVRTLQYYDKEGLLSPSAQSEGGRRLYTDKDIISLHQIKSMKHLGFSLKDIKSHLKLLDTPLEVSIVLMEQADRIRTKIVSLSEALTTIEKLREETLQMKSVNWKKYAYIVTSLQMKNEFYGVIKHFDDNTLDHVRDHFGTENGVEITNSMNSLLRELTELQKDENPPESLKGQAIAKAWWDVVIEFTGGDMSLLPNLIKFTENKNNLDEKWAETWLTSEPYLQKAMEIYLAKLEINPFDIGEDEQ